MIHIFKSLLSITFLSAVAVGSAQSEVFNIGADASKETCDAIMHDSNGGLSPYSPSSNNTITLCPPEGEIQVNLYFIGFNLSEGDSLYVYNGTSTASPLIGAYSAESLLFETISSDNIDGCLTVNFQSNADALVGDFSVRISCGVPCDYPVALIAAESDTLKICQNEAVSFNGSNSSWTEGADLASWTWDFGDQTTDGSSWPSVTHTFPASGGYRVRLYLTDDNECSSANIPEILVFVSTPYNFDLQTDPDLVCLGSEVLIGNSAYIANPLLIATEEAQNGNTVTWTESNNISFDNGVFIPDNEGCLYTDITFNQFGNAEVDEESDISSIFINMEHSFVGDILISVICPTGEVLNLWPEAGGSGTFLGEPIDVEDQNQPGIGYDYTWSPGSTGGTWLEGMDGFGGTIPAGDYEPEGSWSDLFGCPLNGIWQLEVCDVVGADDGFVFEFGLTFNPAFYPEILTFTPLVGDDCESSFWTPQSGLVIADNCDWGLYIPTTAGTKVFTYNVIDDFGCPYSQDISIVAIPEPTITAPDVFLCVSDVNISAQVSNAFPGVTYQYHWSPSTGLSNPNIANPMVGDVTEPTVYTVSVNPSFDIGCTSSETVNVGLIEPPVVQTADDTLYFCNTPLEVFASIVDPQQGVSYTYSWSPPNGLSQANTDSPMVNSIPTDPYSIIVQSYPSWDNQCFSYDTLTLMVPPYPPGAPTDSFQFCIGGETSLLAPITLAGYDYIWYYSEDGEDFVQVPSEGYGSYAADASGSYYVEVYEPICNLMTPSAFYVELSACSVIIPNIFTPNGGGGNDALIFFGLEDFPNSTLQVFNRWGNLVYESNNYKNNWRAEDQAEGTYYFILGIKEGNEVNYHSSHVTLLRQ